MSNSTDRDERTTALGLFNLARSYHEAALTLADQKRNGVDLKAGHWLSPVLFLHYHAVELFLKAFLRLHGHSVDELASRKFGHDYQALEDRARELGLFFMDEDIEVLTLMASTDIVIRSRYIQTGPITFPSIAAMERTNASLRESVGNELINAGLVVRK